MIKLVAASCNISKTREIRQILAPFFGDVVSVREACPTYAEPEEDGTNFLENALIKARAAYAAVRVPVLADDSGIEVDALGGAPGIFSARYAGTPCNDAANNEKLLKALDGLSEKERGARFVCRIVLLINENLILTAEKTAEGRILERVTGSNGFGYDAVFFSDDLQKPFGLATAEEKNSVSHRARALRDIASQLAKLKTDGAAFGKGKESSLKIVKNIKRGK